MGYTGDLTDEEFAAWQAKREAEQNEPRQCSECKAYAPNHTFEATYDRYGIYFGKVCGDCWDKAQERISQWVFDAGDAGETLGDYGDEY